jgi:hypothetical protein
MQAEESRHCQVRIEIDHPRFGEHIHLIRQDVKALTERRLV